MDKPKVLLVDDDRFFARAYREALDREFDVEFVDNADAAIKRVKSPERLDALLLDIMMPTPQGVAAEATDDGFETGIWVLRQTTATLIERRLPVLVLTNRAMRLVTEALLKINLPAGRVVARQKGDTKASELAKIVKDLLAQSRSSAH
jgi:CheY-like chemotaxis protein